jgi:quercetin dioxygenase-like cupin family protein
MSYPPPRYHGDTGEITATLRRHDHAPELVNTAGGKVHYLATGATTGREFGLYRWDFDPGVSGPDAHFHKTITESFYILSGTVRLYDGTQWTDATAGDFLFVPQGGIHGFRNESGQPASMLLLFTPGAIREDYFETLVEVGKGNRTLTDEEWTEFFFRHDTYWL